MLGSYAFIGAFVLVASGLPGLALVLAWALRPKKPNPIKSSTYECGIQTYGDTWVQFKAQYYVYALVFVLFDVETVFLFPWAMVYNQLPLFAIVEMLVFIAILAGALIYAWRKGDLEWI